jgi:hypothetical protein
MGPLEGPTGLAVVETFPGSTGPAHQLGIPAEMLDVTSTTLLSSILAAVQTRLLPYPGSQVVVARKAGAGIEPLTRRVTLAAIRVAFDVRVRAAELSRRQKLGTGLPWHEGSAGRGGHHYAANHQQRRSAPPHWEKIHRYP